MKNLPAKPSAVIRLALADLEKVENDRKKYRVNMNLWHGLRGIKPLCSVCLAGGVMAMSLNVPDNDSCGPHDERFSLPTRHKLMAINNFRMGEVGHGLDIFDTSMRMSNKARKAGISARFVPAYRTNKLAFKRAMENMAKDFEKIDL